MKTAYLEKVLTTTSFNFLSLHLVKAKPYSALLCRRNFKGLRSKRTLQVNLLRIVSALSIDPANCLLLHLNPKREGDEQGILARKSI